MKQLPYASHVVVKSDSGASIPVMHACGHDIHMASWIGTATLMANHRDRWHGTLILVGQPAEETGEGAPGLSAWCGSSEIVRGAFPVERRLRTWSQLRSVAHQ